MSASGFTPIQLYRSTTAAAVPTAGNLVAGELAINLTDEKLYFENASGVVKVLADSTYVGTVTSVAASGGTTGMTFSGGPITGAGTLTLSGTLAVANGGTGQTTYTNGQLLIGNTTGNTLTKATLTAGSGVSISNGTGSITISATGSGGTVTSVDASGGTTGMTFSGGPVTGTGTLTLAGTLAVANGGTGVTASTGTGSVVLSNSPTLVTPTLGAASATSIANGLGAAATPSYTFTGDLNTGMWSPGADTLAFSEGGVEAMRIDSTGNVGIGTSSPVSKLSVSGSFDCSGVGKIGTTVAQSSPSATDIISTSNSILGGQGGNAIYVGQYPTTFASWIQSSFTNPTTATYNIVLQPLGGNVGIGTSTPTQLLHVRQDQNGTTSALIQNRNGSGTPVSAVQFISGAFDLSDNRYAMISSAGGSNTTLQFWTGEGVTPTEKMRVSANGNVGIGTATPEAVLDVNGSQVTRGDASGFVYFAPKIGTSPFGANYDRFEIRVDPSTQVTLLGNVNGGTGSARALAFLAGTNERMRIDTAGNVGIGTTAPGERLTVTQSQNAGTRVAISNQDAGSSATSALRLAASGGFWDILAGSTAANSNALTFGISSTELMRITSAGDVGIGTSGPGYRLDIASGDTTAGLGYAMRLRSNATATAATIQFTTSTVSAQNGIIACSDTGAMTIQTDGVSSVLAFRTNGSERLRILNTGGITSSDLADAVGYKGVPQNAQTSAYTLALSDMGKHISITTGGVVIPANGSVAFPIGSTIVVYNDSGSAQNISITTDTLRLAGTATTGTRSLAQRGLATCVKVAATEWVVTGNVT
jgi:hypothetical protein